MASLLTITASANASAQHSEYSAPEADSSSTELDARFVAEALPPASRLFGAALGMTRNRADAEDPVQETYLKAYSRFHQYESGTNTTAWLYRVSTNTYISHYHKAKCSPARTSTGGVEDRQLVEAAPHDPIGLEPAEVEAPMQMPSEAVKEALDVPSEEQRMVVVLADADSLSYKEITATLGVPIGIVMFHLHRGQAALHRSLAYVATEYGIGGHNEWMYDRQHGRGRACLASGT